MVAVAVLTAMNLRGVRESGGFFAVPTYLFMVAILGMCAYGLLRLLAGDLPDAESAGLTIEPAPGWEEPADAGRADVPARAGLLLGLCGPHRRRGDQQRRTRVPQAQEPQRGDDAAPAGPDRHHDDDERHRARQADDDPLRRSPRAGPAAQRRGRRGPRGLRPAPGDRADRGRRVRPLPAGLLLRHHRHRHHPRAGGQHRLQRLPGARLDPRPGRPGAPVARVARRPARLQQRHRLPRRHVDAADLGLRRRDDQADPALHRRRLRLLQPQPARHDPPLDPPPEDRARPGRPRAGCCARGRSTPSASA